MVMAVDKREDSEAYASAIARLQQFAKKVTKAQAGPRALKESKAKARGKRRR